MKIDDRVIGTTRMIALIGNPVEHTISPLIHNTLSTILDKNLIYVPFKVQKERLDYVIEAFRELGVVGFNITVPYKRDIIKYLDDNTSDSILMGAVNTVKISDGKLFGYNTDGDGFLRSFKEETGTNFRDKNVIMIGAGGVARSIGVKIASEGANSIKIVNRTLQNAKDLEDLINSNVDHVVSIHDWQDSNLNEIFEESDIIINTTAIGMYPDINVSPLLNDDLIKSHHIVYDVIYNPEETLLLKNAQKNGAKVVNGLGMLIYQAIIAYEIWTGTSINEDISKELHKKIKEKIL